MNKQIVSLLLFIIPIGNLFIACNANMNRDENHLEFDSIQIDQTVHLFADTAKPACNLKIKLTYVTQANDQKQADSLNSLILSLCLDDTTPTIPPQEAVAQYAQLYADNYRKDLEPVYLQDAKEADGKEQIGAWYSYYKNIEGRVERQTRQVLIYSMHYEEYTGGAHGIYATTYQNIDLETLCPIRLEDIFKEDYKEKLTDLLWNRLMTDNKVSTRKELEEIGFGSVGDLIPTENFRLDEKGILFYYNVYEIAPYVMGPTAIFIPYKDITALLVNPQLPQRLK